MADQKQILVPDPNNFHAGQDIFTVPINIYEASPRMVTVVVIEDNKCVRYGEHIISWDSFFEFNKIDSR